MNDLLNLLPTSGDSTLDTVLSREPEKGYEARGNAHRGWIHITDQAKFDAHLEKMRDKFMKDLGLEEE